MPFTKNNAKRMGKKAGKASGKARRKKSVKIEIPAAAAEDSAVGDQKLSYRQVIEWVWEHLHEKKCLAAPNRKARELWRYAHKNPDGFLDKYVPMLMRGEKALDEGNEEEEDPIGEPYLKTLRDAMNAHGWGEPPHDWAKNYMDANNCPLDEECPALKAAIEQRQREFEAGRGPREENMSRQLPINQRIAKAKEQLHQLEIEKSQLEIRALGLDGSQNGSQKGCS
jgi:hypothetical protein